VFRRLENRSDRQYREGVAAASSRGPNESNRPRNQNFNREKNESGKGISIAARLDEISPMAGPPPGRSENESKNDDGDMRDVDSSPVVANNKNNKRNRELNTPGQGTKRNALEETTGEALMAKKAEKQAAVDPGKVPAQSEVERPEKSSETVVVPEKGLEKDKEVVQKSSSVAEKISRLNEKLSPLKEAGKQSLLSTFASPADRFMNFLNSKDKAKAAGGNNKTSKSQKSTSSGSSSSTTQKSVSSKEVLKKNNKNDKPSPPPEGFAAARGEDAIIRGTQEMNISSSQEGKQ